ncbi:hypothetical protein OPV22_029633 [Ensete ventricosum]|uniref:SET domain-containing protein n=1 Tax=Ensete ventricosum TaxID=4639 RepID=A0AAV8Q3T4_ENSVE|nr:hypothetical protein OPV22_029633 [Ensete ventricosum]
MAEAAKLRRPLVPCVRDFPKGCGPHAVVIEWKPKEALPPLPPSPPPAPESKEPAACIEVAEPGVCGAPEGASVDIEGKPCLTVGTMEPRVVDSSTLGSGNVAAVKVKQEEELDQGMEDSSIRNRELELSAPLFLENGLEQSKASVVSRTDETLNSDGDPVKQCSPKVYPPPSKTAVSAVRDYPIGCGVNAPRMSKDEALKLAATASSKGKSFMEEKMRAVDQQTVAPKDLATVKVSADNKVAKGMEETLQVEAKVLKSPLPSPKIKSLEEEKQFLSGEYRETKLPIRAATDKRLGGQPIRQLSRDAQRRMTPDLDKVADRRERLSLRKSTDKMVTKYQKVSDSTKRKFLDATVNESDAGTDHNLDVEKLEAHGERLIIQALMAAPNCPWRQGSKSGNSRSRSVAMPKHRVKREQTALNMQLALKEVEDEDAVSGNSSSHSVVVRKRKAKTERTTLNMQLALRDMEDEDIVSHSEENERAFTVYDGSNELSVIDATPLSAFQGSGELSITIPPIVPSGWNYSGTDSQDILARHKVRRALRLFQVVCRKLLQTEEAKSKGSGKIKRVDLTAADILKQKGEWVNTGKQIIGIVPGVEVGDEFHFRVELSIVGLHRPFQGGIDALKKNGIYVATSIVASGGYNDDMDSSDVLIYSGSGGNPAGTDKPPEDQKLQRGNLALKNSIDTKTPVRVIHGVKEMKGGSSHDGRSKLVSTLTYAGLYLVEKYWQEKGPHGFFVYKFQLRRMPGQPELALQEVRKTKRSKVREGLCMKDISDGKEKIPICVVNTVNDEHPPPFKYITEIKYPSWYVKNPPEGCDCMNGCSDSGRCACAVKNGGEIPFNFNGAIVQAKPLLYECGPSCKCPSSCHNRVSQHGIQIPLEIFRTKTRGWGVRSLYSIPSGSFICEYIGELLQDKEAEKRSNDEYLFDIGHNYDDHSLWEGLPSLITGLKTSSQRETVDDVGFTIDAAEYGNVGRFINHSCSPNLYAQNVLYDHDDKRVPHIMLFAAENIPPLQELTYHYNYSLDQVRDADAMVQQRH